MSAKSFQHIKKFVTFFSKPPSYYLNNTDHVLITIAHSHFSERARWILKSINLPYIETPHLPGFHFFFTLHDELKNAKILKRSDSLFSKTEKELAQILQDKDNIQDENTQKVIKKLKFTLNSFNRVVPKLIISNRIEINQDIFPSNTSITPPFYTTTNGSEGIISYLTAQYPDRFKTLIPSGKEKEINEWNEKLSENVGESIKKISFYYQLSNDSFDEGSKFLQKYCMKLNSVTFIEKFVFNFAYKMIFKSTFKLNGINDEVMPKYVETLVNTYKEIESLIEGNNKKNNVENEIIPIDMIGKVKPNSYLLNTKEPSLADITLASLSYPLLGPKEVKDYFYTLDDLKTLKTPGAEYLVGLNENLYKVAPKAYNLVYYMYANHRK